MAYHIQNPFVISFSKIYHIIGVIGFPFFCLCICICRCIYLCICIFVRIWIADIISFQKIYGLRGPWGLPAVLQLIYELRKNWRGRVDGTGEIEGSTRGPRGPKKRHNINQQLVLSVWNIWSPASEVHPILPFFQISPPNMSLISSSAFFLNSNDHLLKTWSKTIIEDDVRHHEIHVMFS